MGWFSKKKNKGVNMEQVKCDDCEKMIDSSECVKSDDSKCLCNDCASKNEK